MAEKEDDYKDIADLYKMSKDRKEKVKTLEDNLPKDTFLELKKDRMVMVPFDKIAQDNALRTLGVLSQTLSDEELIRCMAKINTKPEEREKEQITFSEVEFCILFLFELYHNIGWYAIDQKAFNVVKDKKQWQNVSEFIDEESGMISEDKLTEENSVEYKENSKDFTKSGPDAFEPIVIPPSED